MNTQIDYENERKKQQIHLNILIDEAINKYGVNEHCDFIVGRGKKQPIGYMNYPLNPIFYTRNIIYIDPNTETGADINQYLNDVDFSIFNICKEQDPNEHIQIRIIFDWSSFYCGALQNLVHTMIKIGRRCQILVPLNKDENIVPRDVYNTLNNKLFTVATVEGKYILFDWSKDNLYKMSNYINNERYIKIDVFDNL